MTFKQLPFSVTVLILLFYACDGGKTTDMWEESATKTTRGYGVTRKMASNHQENRISSSSNRDSEWMNKLNTMSLYASQEEAEDRQKTSQPEVMRVSKIYHNTDPRGARNGRQKMNRMGPRGQQMSNVPDLSQEDIMNKIYKNTD